MAVHINDIKSSNLTKLSKSTMYNTIRFGDLVFMEGNYSSSKVIRDLTKSPFSHVLMLWLPFATSVWLTLEATFERGVHIGLFSDYVDHYNGDFVVCNRPKLTLHQKYDGLAFGLNLIDDKYDLNQEFKIAANKLCKLFPVSASKNEYFCSGLMEAIGKYQGLYYKPSEIADEMLSPEGIYTDITVQTKFAYCKTQENS